MRAQRIGRVVAAAAIVLLASTGCSAVPAAVAGSAPDDLPESVQVEGKTVPYAEPQRWTVASIPARSSRTLQVFATGSTDEGGSACGPAVLRFHVEETAETVRVLVAGYQQPRPQNLACAAIGYVPSPHPVRLESPLGDRRLVDAHTGKAATLLVGTDYPDIPVPPGAPARAVLQPGWGDGPVQRRWTYPDGRALTLQVQQPRPSSDVGPYGRTVRQRQIHGSPATVYATGGKEYGTTQVVWTPNREQTITVQLSNSPKRQWTLDEATAIARSVTDYRTADTGRLAQPSSPGTAAASYNSADGPVRHDPNLFKSSGVHIALDCQGTGRVTVTLRDTDYRFECTSTLTHHLRTSVGAPDEPFFVDITADPGVRWAATLARASLDGS
ncbi:hypothetical protein [Amnibacterium endophyticum]|uniref:Uncharacterized protein n=1 Tax=Amnibacterium endophyticum TaxID=2109337 RepID=A0ABW4LI67_9MICO